jgi:hypothetical protein
MPRRPAKPAVTCDLIWQMGIAFPGVEKSISWGSPALKVKGPSGKMELLACIPTNKSAEPNSLLFRIDRKARPAMIEESPDLYYAPDHYLGYDGVLVRLTHLTPALAHDLLAMSHRFVTRKPKK